LMSEAEEPVVKSNILEEGIKTIDIIMFIAAAAGLAIITYVFLKYRKELAKVAKEVEKTELKDEAKDIIDFIKSKGGRTTQKEIRRKFPSSEAKISLIISELENKGVVEKIKKGRGNIILLKKRNL